VVFAFISTHKNCRLLNPDRQTQTVKTRLSKPDRQSQTVKTWLSNPDRQRRIKVHIFHLYNKTNGISGRNCHWKKICLP